MVLVGVDKAHVHRGHICCTEELSFPVLKVDKQHGEEELSDQGTEGGSRGFLQHATIGQQICQDSMSLPSSSTAATRRLRCPSRQEANAFVHSSAVVSAWAYQCSRCIRRKMRHVLCMREQRSALERHRRRRLNDLGCLKTSLRRIHETKHFVHLSLRDSLSSDSRRGGTCVDLHVTPNYRYIGFVGDSQAAIIF